MPEEPIPAKLPPKFDEVYSKFLNHPDVKTTDEPTWGDPNTPHFVVVTQGHLTKCLEHVKEWVEWRLSTDKPKPDEPET